MGATQEQEIAKLRSQLVKLDQAMASGVRRVDGADGTGGITYGTYVEMRQARSDLVTKIYALEVTLGVAAGPRRTRQIVTTGRSGW